MYIIEGEESGFTSIPMGIYWCIVTITTVGYGDISPITPLGQFLAAFLMILGYGVIAVPTGIVTAEIVKSKLKSNLSKTLVCKNCGNSEHIENSNYCQNCGQKLNND